MTKHPDHDFSSKPKDPKTCPHTFVRLVDRWYGQGKYSVFVCNECNATLIPAWKEWEVEE